MKNLLGPRISTNLEPQQHQLRWILSSFVHLKTILIYLFRILCKYFQRLIRFILFCSCSNSGVNGSRNASHGIALPKPNVIRKFSRKSCSTIFQRHDEKRKKEEAIEKAASWNRFACIAISDTHLFMCKCRDSLKCIHPLRRTDEG